MTTTETMTTPGQDNALPTADAASPVPVPPPANSATLTAKTICLSLKMGRFGNTKKASLTGAKFTDSGSGEPDKAMLRLSKTLVESPALDALKKFDSQTALYLRRQGFQSMFRAGIHLIAVGQVEETHKYLEGRDIMRKSLVIQAVNAYDAAVSESLDRLGVQGNPTDYPSREAFARTFYFEWSWVVWDTPTRLKAINAEIFAQERAKAATQLATVAEECRQAMRAGLADLVDKLAVRLEPDADGKSKRLSASTVENLQDFLDTFELRDVTDDAALGAVVAKAREVLSGVDRKQLKKDEFLRSKVQNRLAELAELMEPLVLDKAARKISFEDEADA